MSQLRRCSVKIKTVNEQLLKQTMESIAKFLATHFGNVRVTDKVGDFYARDIRGVVTGIVADSIRGFGIAVQDGKPIIVGDDYMQELTIQKFTNMFENFYTATCMQQALQAMGYQVNATLLPKMEIAVRGVRGAGYGT